MAYQYLAQSENINSNIAAKIENNESVISAGVWRSYGNDNAS